MKGRFGPLTAVLVLCSWVVTRAGDDRAHDRLTVVRRLLEEVPLIDG